MTMPSDAELAEIYRFTLHTRWGIEGAPGSGIGAKAVSYTHLTLPTKA